MDGVGFVFFDQSESSNFDVVETARYWNCQQRDEQFSSPINRKTSPFSWKLFKKVTTNSTDTSYLLRAFKVVAV